MIRHSTSFYCRRCGQVRRFTKRGLDHRKHLYVTILTFGLWGVGWLLLHQREQRRSWGCTICRGRQRPPQKPAEAGRETEPVAAIPVTPRR
jgi:hypothetical protein